MRNNRLFIVAVMMAGVASAVFVAAVVFSVE